jgi:hypothetical protein
VDDLTQFLSLQNRERTSILSTVDAALAAATAAAPKA